MIEKMSLFALVGFLLYVSFFVSLFFDYSHSALFDFAECAIVIWHCSLILIIRLYFLYYVFRLFIDILDTL